MRLINSVILFVTIAASCADIASATAGLIIDPQLLTSRIQTESQVTDSSFIPHEGSDTLIITPKPAANTVALGPFQSSIADTSGDSAMAQVLSFSYSYTGTLITGSASVSSSATFGNGNNVATGMALGVFNEV